MASTPNELFKATLFPSGNIIRVNLIDTRPAFIPLPSYSPIKREPAGIRIEEPVIESYTSSRTCAVTDPLSEESIPVISVTGTNVPVSNTRSSVV